MPMLMMLNRKGGVAKTTNAIAIARCFATVGQRVLLIDADHQCTASQLMLGDAEFTKCDSRRHTLHDLLAMMLEPEFNAEVTHRFLFPIPIGKDRTFDVLPCSARIEDFQTNRAKAQEGFRTTDDFRKALSRNATQFKRYLRKRYDLIVINCPPSLALQIRFFLQVADAYIVPCTPDNLTVNASIGLMERLKDLHITKIRALGLLWGKVKGLEDHKNMIARVGKRKPPYDILPEPFKTHIPDSIAIQRSTDEVPANSTLKSIYGSKAKCYTDVCREIYQRFKRA